MMKKTGKSSTAIVVTLIIVIGAIIFGLIITNFLGSKSASDTITVSGNSQIEVSPDLVSIYYNIQTTGKTSQEAKDKNSEIVENVKIGLISQGFEKKEIQTINFNIYPEYEYPSGRIKLYNAIHSLILKFSTEDIDKIGSAIDAGVNGGATINSINFELTPENQNKYKAEAIKFAAEDARMKAESLVEGLNKKLGKLVSVTDNSFGYSPWILYEGRADAVSADEAKAAVTDIQPNQRTISASVTVVYKIV